MRKISHSVVRGEIELLSGTRIGGSDDVLQIGGADLTCIKDPVTGRPYIPGSSIKGKMRSSLEKHHGKTNLEKPCGCVRLDCPVCRVFGPHAQTRHDLGPTRIIVRDAPLVGDTFAIENKSSTAIDRSTGSALRGALRTEERVAPGAKFKLEIAVQEYDRDEDFTYKDVPGKPDRKGYEALWAVVTHALELTEQTGLGAGTGKGYGQVKITTEAIQKVERTRRPTFAP